MAPQKLGNTTLSQNFNLLKIKGEGQGDRKRELTAARGQEAGRSWPCCCKKKVLFFLAGTSLSWTSRLKKKPFAEFSAVEKDGHSPPGISPTLEAAPPSILHSTDWNEEAPFAESFVGFMTVRNSASCSRPS